MRSFYRDVVDAVTRQYDDLMDKAYREFDRTGTISDDTDEMMRDVEISLMMLGVSL